MKMQHFRKPWKFFVNNNIIDDFTVKNIFSLLIQNVHNIVLDDDPSLQKVINIFYKHSNNVIVFQCLRLT